ncbi:MAG: hypothetical protein KDA80_02190, partial [Planctomycetaceae bacterium]|nr:hypothetical protein [Planctomycetaceae bacterium]
ELSAFEGELRGDPNLQRVLAESLDLDHSLEGFAVDHESERESVLIGIVKTWLSPSFLALPPLLLAVVARFSGDYSMALPGWRDSAIQGIAFAALIAGLLLAAVWAVSNHWRLIRAPFLSGIGGLAALFFSSLAAQTAINQYTESELLQRERIIQDNQWISYTSAYYWPDDLQETTGHPGHRPTEAEIRQELEVLRSAGFTGVLLHECRDPSVARLAKELGFRAVIQGIRVADPSNFEADETQRQISNAIAASEDVDGYILGEFMAREVDWSGLTAELARIRWKTGKPITASFLNEDYLGVRGEQMLEIADFTVRSLSRPFNEQSASVDAAVEKVEDAVMSFQHDTRPGLLSTVFWPTGGGAAFNEDQQYEFFRRVKRLYRPRGVALCYYSSSDRPWARRLAETSNYTPAFEGHTGLFATRELDDSPSLEFVPKRAVSLFREDVQ